MATSRIPLSRVARGAIPLVIAAAVLLGLWWFSNFSPALAGMTRWGMAAVAVAGGVAAFHRMRPREGQRRHDDRRHTDRREHL